VEVATGEGKSLIMTACAIALTLLGRKVDIATSNSMLALRDCKEQTPLYKLFGLEPGTLYDTKGDLTPQDVVPGLNGFTMDALDKDVVYTTVWLCVCVCVYVVV
jgi:preprotein translocase subunit SecA